MAHLDIIQARALLQAHPLYPLIGRDGFLEDARGMMKDVYRTARNGCGGSNWVFAMSAAIDTIVETRKLAMRFGGKPTEYRCQPRAIVKGLGNDRLMLGIRTGVVDPNRPDVVQLATPVGEATRELFRPRAYGGLLGEGTEATACLWVHGLDPKQPNILRIYLMHELRHEMRMGLKFDSSVLVGDVVLDARRRGFRPPTGTTPPLPDLG